MCEGGAKFIALDSLQVHGSLVKFILTVFTMYQTLEGNLKLDPEEIRDDEITKNHFKDVLNFRVAEALEELEPKMMKKLNMERRYRLFYLAFNSFCLGVMAFAGIVFIKVFK